MSTQQAIFWLKNARIIRVILTAGVFIPSFLLAMQVQASTDPIEAARQSAKLVGGLTSNELLALVAIASVISSHLTQWNLTRAISVLDARVAAIQENLHARPCVCNKNTGVTS